MNKKLIQLVDDDPMLVHYMGRALEKAGYKVIGARSYDEALEQLQNENIALSIVDLALQGKSGLDLLNTIRQDARFRQLPIIVQSGFADQMLKEVLALEPVRFFLKPVPINDLLTTIADSLKP